MEFKVGDEVQVRRGIQHPMAAARGKVTEAFVQTPSRRHCYQVAFPGTMCYWFEGKQLQAPEVVRTPEEIAKINYDFALMIAMTEYGSEALTILREFVQYPTRTIHKDGCECVHHRAVNLLGKIDGKLPKR